MVTAIGRWSGRLLLDAAERSRKWRWGRAAAVDDVRSQRPVASTVIGGVGRHSGVGAGDAALRFEAGDGDVVDDVQSVLVVHVVVDVVVQVVVQVVVHFAFDVAQTQLQVVGNRVRRRSATKMLSIYFDLIVNMKLIELKWVDQFIVMKKLRLVVIMADRWR